MRLPAGTFLVNPSLSQSVNYWNNALLPYAGWGNLTAVETNAFSRYNALMFRLSRRFANNFSVNFNYTHSQVMDVTDTDDGTINNPFCIRCSYGPAGYNQPNVESVDFVYMLPTVKGANPFVKYAINGWELSGMIREQSGEPVNITSNGNLMGVNLPGSSQYPNLVGDPYANTNGGQILNPLAFQRPQDGQYGGLGRNALHLPSIFNADVSIMKNFNFTESVKATFRCEVYNLFNHPELWAINNGFSGDNPGSGLSASAQSFGQPASNGYRDARTIQLALRFAF